MKPPLLPTVHTTCRICRAPLVPILSLGSLYPSDFPNHPDTKAHPAVPLHLTRCESSACGLVQLQHTTPPEWLYRQYWYKSGVNESMVAELRDVVEGACRRVDLPRGSTVVDIGANDGTLLKQYPLLGYDRLLKVAWEPATNLYEDLRPHAQVLFPEFFRVPERWAPNTQARVVTSVAMFYDLDDPHAFVESVGRILHKDGIWIIQQAYLGDMLATTGIDNSCHEHLEYYHLKPLQALLRVHGMEVVDVERRAINGGSFRVYVQWMHRSNQTIPAAVAGLVERWEEMEASYCTDPAPAWLNFVGAVNRMSADLQARLAIYATQRQQVDLYAASTKANTLLQFCGIDHRLVRQAWERSPAKIGRYVGTTGIPIVSEEQGRADPPQVLLVGAWQFKEAMVAREQAFLKAGGRMLFPLPSVEEVRG